MGHYRSGHRERGEHGRMVRARMSSEAEQAAAYVDALAQALRAGGVTIRSGAGLVALRTADRIDLELEAGEEGRQSVVRLALRWETPAPEERLDITPGVSEQPAAAAPEPPPATPGAGSAGSGGRPSPRQSGGGKPSSATGDSLRAG